MLSSTYLHTNRITAHIFTNVAGVRFDERMRSEEAVESEGGGEDTAERREDTNLVIMGTIYFSLFQKI